MACLASKPCNPLPIAQRVVKPLLNSVPCLAYNGQYIRTKLYSTAWVARLKTMGFFDSEIVQQEAKQLFEDYQSLMQIGTSYGKFDREGKKLFSAVDGGKTR